MATVAAVAPPQKRDIRDELSNIGVDDDIVNDVLRKIRARRMENASTRSKPKQPQQQQQPRAQVATQPPTPSPSITTSPQPQQAKLPSTQAAEAAPKKQEPSSSKPKVVQPSPPTEVQQQPSQQKSSRHVGQKQQSFKSKAQPAASVQIVKPPNQQREPTATPRLQEQQVRVQQPQKASAKQQPAKIQSRQLKKEKKQQEKKKKKQQEKAKQPSRWRRRKSQEKSELSPANSTATKGTVAMSPVSVDDDSATNDEKENGSSVINIQLFRIEIESDAVVPGEGIEPKKGNNIQGNYVEQYEMVPHITSKNPPVVKKTIKKASTDEDSPGEKKTAEADADAQSLAEVSLAETEATQLTFIPEDAKNVFESKVLQPIESEAKPCSMENVSFEKMMNNLTLEQLHARYTYVVNRCCNTPNACNTLVQTSLMDESTDEEEEEEEVESPPLEIEFQENAKVRNYLAQRIEERLEKTDTKEDAETKVEGTTAEKRQFDSPIRNRGKDSKRKSMSPKKMTESTPESPPTQTNFVVCIEETKAIAAVPHRPSAASLPSSESSKSAPPMPAKSTVAITVTSAAPVPEKSTRAVTATSAAPVLPKSTRAITTTSVAPTPIKNAHNVVITTTTTSKNDVPAPENAEEKDEQLTFEDVILQEFSSDLEHMSKAFSGMRTAKSVGPRDLVLDKVTVVGKGNQERENALTDDSANVTTPPASPDRSGSSYAYSPDRSLSSGEYSPDRTTSSQEYSPDRTLSSEEDTPPRPGSKRDDSSNKQASLMTTMSEMDPVRFLANLTNMDDPRVTGAKPVKVSQRITEVPIAPETIKPPSLNRASAPGSKSLPPRPSTVSAASVGHSVITVSSQTSRLSSASQKKLQRSAGSKISVSSKNTLPSSRSVSGTRERSGLSKIFTQWPPRASSTTKSKSVQSGPVSPTRKQSEVFGPPSMKKAESAEARLQLALPEWGAPSSEEGSSAGASNFSIESCLKKPTVEPILPERYSAPEPTPDLMSLSSLTRGLSVFLNISEDTTPPITPKRGWLGSHTSSKSSKKATFAPSVLEPETSYRNHSETDDESVVSALSAHMDKATDTASGIFSTDTTIDDMWLAKEVLNKYARTKGINVDDLIEDVCDQLDQLDSKMFLPHAIRDTTTN